MDPNRSKNQLLDTILSLLSAAMLIFFAVPKITGDETSARGFADFSPSLGLDPNAFMLFTGYSEFAFAAILIVGLIMVKRRPLVLWIANTLLLATMLSALFVEFFARTQFVSFLVVIAIVFAIISSFQLVRHFPLFTPVHNRTI